MTNKIQNQVAVQNEKALANGGKKTMQGYIKSMEGEIAKALPSVMTPERFTRMVLSAISTNPKLAECTPASFLGAMMSAAQLGLEPNTQLGEAYILPYNNKGTLEAQFQIGYKGLIDLAWRGEELKSIEARIVYANDTFECEYGMDAKLKHIPADKDRGDAVKVYAMFKTKSDGFCFEVMSIDDVKRHAEKYSKAYKSGFSPWSTSFEEMAKKTVLKRVLKYAPLRSDFVKAVVQDGSIKNEISEDMYEVPGEVIDADYTDVDADTGEIVENSEE